MPIYQVAVVLTVPALTYHEAVLQLTKLENRIAPHADIGVRIITEYEYNYRGQRVLCLPPENSTL